MSALCRIALLGEFSVQQDQRRITRFRTQKAGALLAFLAYHPDSTHPREHLIELLWPSLEPSAGRANLSFVLSTLRYQLEPPGVQSGTVLIADRNSVRINPAAITTDVAEFETGLTAMEELADDVQRVQRLDETLALYRGPLLPGYYEEWVAPERQRLADRYVDAARQLVRGLAKAGELGRAIDKAQHAIGIDPLQEALHCDLMRLYVALGKVPMALQQYSVLERSLHQELGGQPAAATRELVRAIRSHQQQAEARLLPYPEERAGTTTVQETDSLSAEAADLVLARRASTTTTVPRRGAEEPTLAPSGTVTLLLAQWKRLPNAPERSAKVAAPGGEAKADVAEGMAKPTAQEGGANTARQAQAGQAARLRRELGRHGGHTFQRSRQGQGVAFQSVGEALTCAIAVQRNLTSANATEAVGAFGLCMALHTGDIEPGAQGLQGQVLDQTWRLLEAGHPGQILCSEATSTLLRRDLQVGERLLDLGLFRLRDVPVPEHIFEVEYPGKVPKTCPPLRAAAGYTAHLPLPLTRFFGREELLASLQSLLLAEATRLVSLTGTGGMGKTRLAMEATRRLLEAFAGSVWFVPLADVGVGTGLLSALVDALGLQRSSQVEPMEQVSERLSCQRSLLVLDNFEHLVEAEVATVGLLLGRVPTLKCLVTSRQRLELGGEQEVVVPPLPVPEDQGRGTSEWRQPHEQQTPQASSASRVHEQQTPQASSASRVHEQQTPQASSASRVHEQQTPQAGECPQGRGPDPGSASRGEGRTLGEEGREGIPLFPLPSSLLSDPLSLLSVPSVALFVDRAQAVKPDFQITAGNAEAIATLCRRLEGIPLAVELAASRAQVLTVGQTLSQLENRFKLLVSRRRDVAPRHRTLRQTIDWSYDLLPAPLQRFFARLSVFRGGFSLEAAEVVCEEERALDCLAQLRDCSLILAEEGSATVRFRMLETLREYAQDRLVESAESMIVRRRHRDHFLTLAEETRPKLGGAQQAHWLNVLEEEHDNLREVVAFCLEEPDRGAKGLRLGAALQEFWSTRGHVSEGRERLGVLLSRLTPSAPSNAKEPEEAQEHTRARADALNGSGVLAWKQGDYASAYSLHEESLALFRELGHKRGIGLCLLNLGNVAQYRGDYASARALFEESLVMQRELGDKRDIANCLSSLGSVVWRQGDYASARSLLEESLATQRELGDKRNIANSLFGLGNVVYHQGEYVSARSLLEESLAIQRELGDKRGIANSLNNLGIVATDKGDYALVQSLITESLAIQRDMGDKYGIANSLGNLGNATLRQGDPASARSLYEESLAIRREMGDKGGIAHALDSLAHAVGDQGDYASARTLLNESLAILRELGDKGRITMSLETFAALALIEQRAERSARLWGATTAMREALGFPLAASQREIYEREMATLHELLGEAAFAATWAEGRSRTMDQAIEYALEPDV